MIVVTGAAGFIGSCMIAKLNQENFIEIVAVDDFSSPEKKHNYKDKKIKTFVHRLDFHNWLDSHHKAVQFIFHLGARTDTTEKDNKVFESLNLNYSKSIWKACIKYTIPLIYASSAATYGGGENGFCDRHEGIVSLKALNPYGQSKQDFDCWVLSQKQKPFFWAGFKFFNVYGPNEYHKDRMASVIFHAYHQIIKNKKLKLFQSHKPEYNHGEQMRDFIYIKDVVDTLFYFMIHRKHPAIYNLGTGQASSFLSLASAIFNVLSLPLDIEFIPIPQDIRNNYQYYTQADITKLQSTLCPPARYSLSEGIVDYLNHYLIQERWM